MLTMAAGVAPAAAAGLSADATCQRALTLGVRTVAAAALKGIEKCHRKRMRGRIAASVDCNDPGQLTGGPRTRVQRAVDKLNALAERRCVAATAPATLGYAPCPAPCDAISVGAYTEVSACLACLTHARVHDLSRTLFATPDPPGGRSAATMCHAALARATRRYAGTRMRAQWECKTVEAKGGVTGSDCRDGDFQGQISAAWSQLQAQVSSDASCTPASLATLDLCPSASDGTHVRDATAAIDVLHACAAATVGAATNDLFDRAYAPGSPPPAAPSRTNVLASRWVSSGGPSLDERNPRFRLIVDEAATVTIDLSSTTADAYLYLLNANGSTVLAQDDNGAGGSDSRIVAALGPGRYLLVAATASAAASGRFTIRSDLGSIKACFLAYANANHAGASTRFCDGGTGEPFSNNAYSSLRVPHGLFVRAYENADRSGRAHTYYGDAPSLQPFLDNTISSIEWGAFATDDFFVVMVSDPQITWGYCSDNPGSSLCAQEQSFFGSATEQAMAWYYNANLTAAVNAIKDRIGLRAFGGVIVNGDLTEFGRQDHDLEDYIDLYDHGIEANVYPGLGNHDYANNVDDCFANLCASAMVNYFATQVSSLNSNDFDYSVTTTPLSGTPSIRYDRVGSFGYSFDIGDVHFVQLNNYPTYTRVWEHALPNSVTWYTIESSIDWLYDDLPIAALEGKRIVANLHDWGSANVTAFRDVLDDFPVSAVYAGHYHGTYGRYVESGPYSDGKPVPVFLSGSAHYGTMLVTRFTSDTLYVWVLRVDQFNGAVLQVRSGGGFADVVDLDTLFDICPGCTTTYEYAYQLR